MAEAQARADRCALAAEEARRGWDDALRGLLQAEQVARRTAEGVPRDAPDPAAIASPTFPTTTLGEAGAPPAVTEKILGAWNEWTAAARERRVATADLEGRFEAVTSGWRAGEAGRAVAGTPRRGADRAGVGGARAAHRRGRALRPRGRHDRRVGPAPETRPCAAPSTWNGACRTPCARGWSRSAPRPRPARISSTRRCSQLEGKFASIRRDARGTIVSLADILFDFNKATLRREVEFSLVRVATILNQFPEMKVQIEGHTDNVGTADYNLELSQRRSQAVQDFLASQQVAAERMTSEGFGMTRPVADNTTAEGRQKNRRVDLVIEETP